ncbi:uncharacterized protein LOC132060744 [Lycium ferocissimum]|uniref:uncharacterized protein LOC132060744 n=1 Tax=Lycium ferocissimum TaxID=112874 RepID=UPI00281573C0|nr:uncharacterized protein LOC132060744 [Lycium ferocissimum]
MSGKQLAWSNFRIDIVMLSQLTDKCDQQLINVNQLEIKLLKLKNKCQTLKNKKAKEEGLTDKEEQKWIEKKVMRKECKNELKDVKTRYEEIFDEKLKKEEEIRAKLGLMVDNNSINVKVTAMEDLSSIMWIMKNSPQIEVLFTLGTSIKCQEGLEKIALSMGIKEKLKRNSKYRVKDSEIVNLTDQAKMNKGEGASGAK